MTTATLERPTETADPERDRLAHLVIGTLPGEALCGWYCTRPAAPGMEDCAECERVLRELGS